jgi:hypothetical protein
VVKNTQSASNHKRPQIVLWSGLRGWEAGISRIRLRPFADFCRLWRMISGSGRYEDGTLSVAFAGLPPLAAFASAMTLEMTLGTNGSRGAGLSQRWLKFHVTIVV